MTDGQNYGAYRVLARKYRPQTFQDLIGQDVMVTTLTNAFTSGRIAQAFMLTGLRGIGKTTTARILARALNYEPLEKSAPNQPSLDMPSLGKHCQAIIDSQHIDVLEMDAASHTGIDDIREIIENARYRPSTARYKIYIIDEVHMLSKAAFNGLLKTLEEPPHHVKFIFATTEIRKVPTTILSRCQRFTLARIDTGLMTEHLMQICKKEAVDYDQDALKMIAKASEGSVRDALSILDQAMALSPDKIHHENVLSMLGLAPKASLISMFEDLIKGDTPAALNRLNQRYQEGDDPAVIIADLAEFCHLVTRFKVTGEAINAKAITEEEHVASRKFSETLGVSTLSTLWQMLIKGHDEIINAPKAIVAAEMVMIRIGYTASLPSPETLINHLNQKIDHEANHVSKETQSKPISAKNADHTQSTPVENGINTDWAQAILSDDDPKIDRNTTEENTFPPSSQDQKYAEDEAEKNSYDFQALVDLAEQHRDLQIKHWLIHKIRLISIEGHRLDIALVNAEAEALVKKASAKLHKWTQEKWNICVHESGGAPSLGEQAEIARKERIQSAKKDQNIKLMLETFPEAELIDIKKTG